MIESVLRLVLRHSRIIVTIGLILGTLGGYYTVQLYRNLRPDLQEMLPNQERSVKDLEEISSRLRSIDNLTVLVFTKDADAGRKFVDDLAVRLSRAPSNIIAGIEYRITQELRFFSRRRALYMELRDLEKIRKYIRDRIDYETNIRNPLNIFSEIELPVPKLDFHALRQEYQSRIEGYTRFPEGYYATPDGTKRAILVNAPGRASDIGMARRLKKTVDDAIVAIDPLSYAPDLRIAFTGGVQNIVEEQEALVQDLKRSMVIVTVIVLLAMLLYFGSAMVTFALLSSVIVATLVTFGIAYFLIGYLNANSAFLGSIVIGNGINFGIILLSRYLERRRTGESVNQALCRGAGLTATSTWTAALAAGLAYGSLMATDFRGFRQFGIIGLIGMVLCWISAFTFLPALVSLLDAKKKRHPLKVVKKADPQPNGFPGFLVRFARPLWILTLAATAVSFVSIALWPAPLDEIMEANLAKLRSRRSLTEGSAYYSRFQDEIFQRYLSPIVILARNRQEARQIAGKLRDASKDANNLIASVQTLDDFIPDNQSKKMAVIREIRRLLPVRVLSELPAQERKLALELIQTPLFPIRRNDLPALILEKFTERNGSIGNLVITEPPIGEEIRKRNNLLRFVHTLREITDSVSPGAPVAGTLPVSADTLASISRDGPKATLVSLLAVVLLVTVLFRHIRTIGSVLFALALGGVWLVALILAFDIRINFLNFIALPLTIGLGVDYGVNVFQRYRQEGPGKMPLAVRQTGGAVALCSFTTIVGYGSLLLAQNLAFVSFGVLAILGAITCVTAALVSVPVYRITKDRKLRDSGKRSDTQGDATQEIKRAG